MANTQSHHGTNLASPLLNQAVLGSETPSRADHQDYLDGWRGCAIAFLLIGHFFPIAGINFGRIGVDLFFVLSGLLMGRLLFIQKLPINIFYRRRIARIFPACLSYIGCVLLYFFFSGKAIDWLETTVATLFIYNYFLTQIGVPHMPFGHIWSLSVEEHIYIVLSLIALLSSKHILRVRNALIGLTSAALLIGLIYGSIGFSHRDNLLMQSEVACFGIVISCLILVLSQKVKLPYLSLPMFVFLFFCAIACHWWSFPTWLSTFVSLTLLAFLINALPTAAPTIQNILSFYPLRKLGIGSYSIYLWQQIFYLAHHREGLNASLALLLALIAGLASYFLIEKPARRYLNHHWGKQN